MTTGTALSSTERTRVSRHPERARASREDLYAVLDAGMICHVGLVADGYPVVLPTAYGRCGDTLYLHGSSGNQSMRAAAGQQVCVTVTHTDGLVCARSAFSHSVNYRSAVVFGAARVVTDPEERLLGLRTVTDHLIPGRWDAVRPPSRKELAATMVAAVPLGEASVKIRSGPPAGDPGEQEDVWAGVVPMTLAFGPPQTAPDVPAGVAVPDHIRALAGRAAAIAPSGPG